MAKEELLNEGRALSVDLLEVTLAGQIDPAPENLCKLLFFAMEVNRGKGKTKNRQRWSGLEAVLCWGLSKESTRGSRERTKENEI